MFSLATSLVSSPDIQVLEHLQVKDIQEQELALRDRVNHTDQLLPRDRVMEAPHPRDRGVTLAEEEEDTHLAARELGWTLRSSSGSVQWIKTGAARLTTKNSSVLL